MSRRVNKTGPVVYRRANSFSARLIAAPWTTKRFISATLALTQYLLSRIRESGKTREPFGRFGGGGFVLRS